MLQTSKTNKSVALGIDIILWAWIIMDNFIYTLLYTYKESKLWISSVKQHMHLLTSSATISERQRDTQKERERATESKTEGRAVREG